MDGELGERLQAVLSDPVQMEKLGEMAKSLFGQQPAAQEQTGAGREEKPPQAPPLDDKLLSAIGRAFASDTEKSRSTQLLLAMRPYMKPEKQEKLDRALQVARMAHIAGAVMRQYGGDGHGL